MGGCNSTQQAGAVSDMDSATSPKFEAAAAMGVVDTQHMADQARKEEEQQELLRCADETAQKLKRVEVDLQKQKLHNERLVVAVETSEEERQLVNSKLQERELSLLQATSKHAELDAQLASRKLDVEDSLRKLRGLEQELEETRAQLKALKDVSSELAKGQTEELVKEQQVRTSRDHDIAVLKGKLEEQLNRNKVSSSLLDSATKNTLVLEQRVCELETKLENSMANAAKSSAGSEDRFSQQMPKPLASASSDENMSLLRQLEQCRQTIQALETQHTVDKQTILTLMEQEQPYQTKSMSTLGNEKSRLEQQVVSMTDQMGQWVAENDDLQRIIKDLQDDNKRLARDNKQQAEELQGETAAKSRLEQKLGLQKGDGNLSAVARPRSATTGAGAVNLGVSASKDPKETGRDPKDEAESKGKLTSGVKKIKRVSTRTTQAKSSEGAGEGKAEVKGDGKGEVKSSGVPGKKSDTVIKAKKTQLVPVGVVVEDDGTRPRSNPFDN